MGHGEPTPPLIEVVDVVRRYGDIEVLAQINLSVYEGEFLSLVGPSGCGKSTLLRIMAGLHPASSGVVRVEGQVVDAPPPQLTYIFQHYNRALYPWLTVMKNLEFGLRHGWLRNASPESWRERATEMIAAMGLSGFENSYPWQLSGGMQQRLALARGLVCQARILLLDEPFSSVDAQTRASLQDLMLSLWKKYGLTAVLVTHDIDEAIYISSRVVALSPRPTRVVATTDVDLPYPRKQLPTRSSNRFLELRNHVYTSLFG
jgi:NitT/TauT family transport system ATP-binding protein